MSLNPKLLDERTKGRRRRLAGWLKKPLQLQLAHLILLLLGTKTENALTIQGTGCTASLRDHTLTRRLPRLTGPTGTVEGIRK